MLITISISPAILHLERVAGTTVDAASAVNAVGVAEEAIQGIAGRVAAEGAGFGTETAFDAFAFPCHDRCSFRITWPHQCGRSIHSPKRWLPQRWEKRASFPSHRHIDFPTFPERLS